jgi:A/G-specific adenine glycosylase
LSSVNREEPGESPICVESLRTTLLRWYDRNRRTLPWRADPGEEPDPYHVWTAEVMLQQTRVETVRSYYSRWLSRFPTLADLAAASQDEVLKEWAGLGYYSRARNFHRAAREVAARYGGRVPDDPDALRGLAGVGRYTTGAVLSIAFGREEPVVDGNVRRVFARWWNEPRPTDRALWSRAKLMELGATVCTPRSPRCGTCPVEAHCAARAEGTQAERPTRSPARLLPHEDTVVAVVIDARERVLLVRRPTDSRLGGMWEFPSTIRGPDETPATAAIRALRERFGLQALAEYTLGELEHLFSHVRVTYRPVRCRLAAGAPRFESSDTVRWVRLEETQDYALPAAQRRISTLALSRSSATDLRRSGDR